MNRIADIVREFGPEYLRRFGAQMPANHRKALRAIADCHTPAMGGHRFRCEECGAEHFRYHSCRNRSCPSCQSGDREEWISNRLQALLPCRYFHLVFTVPQELNGLIRSHQSVLLDVLMRAAGQCLQILAADSPRLGGAIGVLQVLHTWGASLNYHPHVHCLVPGGALREKKGIWKPRGGRYLLPVKTLSRVFREMFLAMAKHALPDDSLPDIVSRKEWVVFCKPVDQGPEKVIEYLGRYIHRTAISEGRIVAVQDGQVTFAYKDYRTKTKKTMTLPGCEFLRRFLQHVLPRGFHKVRYLGLFSPSKRKSFLSLQAVLWRLSGRLMPPIREKTEETISCPGCGSKKVVCLERIPRPARGPPRSEAMTGNRRAENEPRESETRTN